MERTAGTYHLIFLNNTMHDADTEEYVHSVANYPRMEEDSNHI